VKVEILIKELKKYPKDSTVSICSNLGVIRGCDLLRILKVAKGIKTSSGQVEYNPILIFNQPKKDK
jgi:hypothetical protein